MSTTHIIDSDSDSDDEQWLNVPLYYPYNISCNAPRISPTNTNKPTINTIVKHERHTHNPSPKANSPGRYTYRVKDDVIVRDSEHTTHCQVVSIKRNRDGTASYHLLANDARPNDARIILHETQMHDTAIVQPWTFTAQPTVFTTELLQCASASGVTIVPTQFGNGLQAAQDLPKGHCIPYWGKLSAIQRDGGMYNAEIADGVYIIADDPSDRGPATFCNDNTIQLHRNGTIEPTRHRANGKLTWTIPYDSYLDDWKNYLNDGEEFVMYVELVRDVKRGEAISVCYGVGDYWNDKEVGQRMSNAISVE